MQKGLTFIVAGIGLIGFISFTLIKKSMKVNDLNAEVEALKEQELADQAKIDSTVARIDSLEMEAEIKDQRIQELEAEIAFLNEELTVALDSMSMLQEKLGTETTQKERLTQELRGWVIKVKELKAERVKIQEELAEALRQLGEKREHGSDIKGAIKTSSAEKPELPLLPPPQSGEAPEQGQGSQAGGGAIPDGLILQANATIRTLELKNKRGNPIEKVRPNNWHSTDLLLEVFHPDPKIQNQLEGQYFGLEIFDEQNGTALSLREKNPRYDTKDETMLRVRVVSGTIGGSHSNWEEKEGSNYRVNVYYLPDGDTKGRKLRIPVTNEKIITDNFIDEQFSPIW